MLNWVWEGDIVYIHDFSRLAGSSRYYRATFQEESTSSKSEGELKYIHTDWKTYVDHDSRY